MRKRRALSRLGKVAALAGVTVITAASAAVAHPSDVGGDSADDARDAKRHADAAGHLPGSSKDVALVGETTLKNVEPEKIADVSVFKDYAYLAAWGVVTCKYNGVHVVDIKDPAAPKEVAFVSSKEGSYPGEGVQATTISTPAFTGDILVTNNEKCNEKTGFGGLNIYDVSNPKRPTPLAVGIGDTTSTGVEAASGQGKKAAHSVHSVFAWDAGDKAYAAIVDNDEAADVDIMDITNPKAPFLTAEYDLAELFPGILQALPANLTEVFLHDMVVQEVDGRFRMSANYWDAGYVIMDVTDVKSPRLIADSDYAMTDPELVGTPYAAEAPEGNAHQSEWTKDRTHLIGTDEDFAPYRSGPFTIDGDTYPAVAVSGGGTAADTPDKNLNGPVVYGGYGCPGSAAIPPASDTVNGVALLPGEEKIVVLQRGPSGDPTATEEACFPGDKAAAAVAAGYDGVVLVNRHLENDEAYCGAGGFPVGSSIPTVCASHAAFHDLFATEQSSSYPEAPAIGAVGGKVSATALFNGWGYVHLFEAEKPTKAGPTKLKELDTYAVPEAHDPAFAKGFGDLSVHEVATSVTRNDLAYFSYYAAGMRVTKIVDGELVEVGHYIDTDGSDFWGVEAFVGSDGTEYFAGSDRNFGLQIFKYTGPS